VVKLVDTHVSEACGASYAGSSPAFGTKSSDHSKWSDDFITLSLFLQALDFRLE
jgi:hypothetical protein